jgi:hypothetical protein
MSPLLPLGRSGDAVAASYKAAVVTLYPFGGDYQRPIGTNFV